MRWPRAAPRRAYIVEDSGAGEAARDPVVRFRLVREGEGSAVANHLSLHPTLSMEAFRGIPLAPYWRLDSSSRLGREPEGRSQVGVYVILDGTDPAHEGERIDVVGGKFAIGTLATRAEVSARWAGRIRSSEFTKTLLDEGPPLPTVAEIEQRGAATLD